jgi:hypothetical protein
MKQLFADWLACELRQANPILLGTNWLANCQPSNSTPRGQWLGLGKTASVHAWPRVAFVAIQSGSILPLCT